jgi:hypothetical protein
MAVTIEIRWRAVQSRSDAWNWSRCLYAYVDPKGMEILYIGKAWGTTVRQRFRAPDKVSLFEFLARELGVNRVEVLVGEPLLEPGRRLTRELLADVESLLIRRLRPRGNVTATQSRIARPGLEVLCTGHWPLTRARFRDLG